MDFISSISLARSGNLYTGCETLLSAFHPQLCVSIVADEILELEEIRPLLLKYDITGRGKILSFFTILAHSEQHGSALIVGLSSGSGSNPDREN